MYLRVLSVVPERELEVPVRGFDIPRFLGENRKGKQSPAIPRIDAQGLQEACCGVAVLPSGDIELGHAHPGVEVVRLGREHLPEQRSGTLEISDADPDPAFQVHEVRAHPCQLACLHRERERRIPLLELKVRFGETRHGFEVAGILLQCGGEELDRPKRPLPDQFPLAPAIDVHGIAGRGRENLAADRGREREEQQQNRHYRRVRRLSRDRFTPQSPRLPSAERSLRS